MRSLFIWRLLIDSYVVSYKYRASVNSAHNTNWSGFGVPTVLDELLIESSQACSVAPFIVDTFYLDTS